VNEIRKRGKRELGKDNVFDENVELEGVDMPKKKRKMSKAEKGGVMKKKKRQEHAR